MLENLATYSEESAQQHLVCEGYAKDADLGAHMDQIESTNSSNEEVENGNTERNEWFVKGPVGFNFPLHLDFAKVGKVWLDLVPIVLSLSLAEDKFLLLTAANSLQNSEVTMYRYRLKSARLECRRYLLSQPVKNWIERTLVGKRARYPITKCTIKKYHLSAGSTSFNWNLIATGKLPFHTTLAMVSQQAAGGHFQKNPFRFNHYDIDDLFFSFNNHEYPVGHYRPKLHTNNLAYLKEYARFQDNLTVGRANTRNMITHKKWKEGYNMYSVDTTADSCSGYHRHESIRGSMSIGGTFKTQLPENVTLILYSAYFDEIQVSQC